MAEKISLEIGLDGGDEVNRQLESVLQQGERTFSGIQQAADQLDFSAIADGFQNVGETGVQAFDKIQAAVKSTAALEGIIQGIKKLEGAFDAVGTAVTRMGARMTRSLGLLGVFARSFGTVGIQAGVAVGAVIAATKATISFAESVNKVNDTAIKLGVGVKQLDSFRRGLEQAGVSAESVGQILQSKLVSEQGIKGLEAFIRQLESMPDGLARSKAATEAFGDAGAELIRILQAGSRLTGQFGAGLISEEDAKKATELGMAINRLGNSFSRLSTVSIAPQLTAGLDLVTAGVEKLGARLEQAPWLTFLTGAQLVFNPIQGLVNATIQAIFGIGPAIQKVGTQAAEASTLFTQWGTTATQSADQAKTAFTSFGTTIEQTGQKAAQAGQTAASGWNVFLAKLREIALAAGRLLGGGGGGGSGTPAMAGGGLLGGSGTGTSDSNLAWVSRGEYITPARAVAQPGVLSFLEALRRSGGNLSRVLNGMGRFALGGLVPRMPAYAAGGLAGGSNVTIQFPGLPAISGLRASADVVDQLHKAAALAQVRSGGRKPSRYS